MPVESVGKRAERKVEKCVDIAGEWGEGAGLFTPLPINSLPVMAIPTFNRPAPFKANSTLGKAWEASSRFSRSLVKVGEDNCGGETVKMTTATIRAIRSTQAMRSSSSNPRLVAARANGREMIMSAHRGEVYSRECLWNWFANSVNIIG